MSKPAVNGSSSLDVKEKAAIDKYKRSGGFDRARKEILQQWESSEQASAFRTRLESIVKAEIARDPSLLHRDRGKAATLIAGAVERYEHNDMTKFQNTTLPRDEKGS